MKPPCFWSSATHRSKTLKSRQAAKAKDLSAASAPIHARPQRLNLFCEASLLLVSPQSPLQNTQFKPPKKTSSNSEGPLCRLSPYSCKTSDDQICFVKPLCLCPPPFTAQRHSVQAAKEDKQQRRRTFLPPQPLFMQDL